MAHADVVFFFTVESEIHTAAISHEFIDFAEIEQRVVQINTGMGFLFSAASKTHSKFCLQTGGFHGTGLCRGSLEVPNPPTVQLFSECTLLSHSRKLSFWHTSCGSIISRLTWRNALLHLTSDAYVFSPDDRGVSMWRKHLVHYHPCHIFRYRLPYPSWF